MQGFLAFEIVVASVPQSNKPNPIKGFFPVIGFVKIAVDRYDFILFYYAASAKGAENEP